MCQLIEGNVSPFCRTGKIMKYNPTTGKRIKDPDAKFKINWVHSLLKKNGTLDESWQLTQCLFGEHLLPQHPDKPIALIESEKTAIICSGLMPQYLWLATGGKSQLSQEKLSVLAGRKTIAFPDIDGYEEWKKKLSAAEIDIIVSDILQRILTRDPQPDKRLRPHSTHRRMAHLNCPTVSKCPAVSGVSPLGQRDRRDKWDKKGLD